MDIQREIGKRPLFFNVFFMSVRQDIQVLIQFLVIIPISLGPTLSYYLQRIWNNWLLISQVTVVLEDKRSYIRQLISMACSKDQTLC